MGITTILLLLVVLLLLLLLLLLFLLLLFGRYKAQGSLALDPLPSAVKRRAFTQIEYIDE